MPDVSASTTRYTIGIDFGTNSVRAIVVDLATGEEVGTSVCDYPSGEHGVLLDAREPDLARQRPQDYLVGLEHSVRGALHAASGSPSFASDRVIGIGIDTTGSTPIPVDAHGDPLAFQSRFRDRLAAQVWLWKDHTAHVEAERITVLAAVRCPDVLAQCGGRYSSEWYWAKILHCATADAEVFDAAHTWVEHADWIPAVLTGTTSPSQLRRGVCAAGHKALFVAAHGGYPDESFFTALDARLVRVRRTLPDRVYGAGERAGALTTEWATRLGLPAGIAVSIGAFDAHLGAIGAGIGDGTMVKIIGTSTCDLMVAPIESTISDIPGLCGVVPGSVMPGYYGLEAGQSAVGDIFSWWVDGVRPSGLTHAELSSQAARLEPGESGVLALDWWNGNRTVLVDPRLTGLMLGLTLQSSPGEIYRALIEATAFGARVIQERFEAYGVPVQRVVNCGGIAEKNPVVMQIYADVLGRSIAISRSGQTCALGAAIAGAVAAGASAGGYAQFAPAIASMTGVRETVFTPRPAARATYDQLYAIYRQLHDAFGGADERSTTLASAMKDLLDLRDAVRRTSRDTAADTR